MRASRRTSAVLTTSFFSMSDAHHYEGENFDEFVPYMENDAFRQQSPMSGRKKGNSRAGVMVQGVGYQDMGGRVTRYPLRSSEKTEPGFADNAMSSWVRHCWTGRDER